MATSPRPLEFAYSRSADHALHRIEWLREHVQEIAQHLTERKQRILLACLEEPSDAAAARRCGEEAGNFRRARMELGRKIAELFLHGDIPPPPL